MTITITKYNAVCNLGTNIEKIYKEAIDGNINKFFLDKKTIPDTKLRLGKISEDLPKINNKNFNTRCNRMIKLCLEPLLEDVTNLKLIYGKDKIGIVVATTNTGIDEYSSTYNKIYSELGNPALFIKDYLGLESYYNTISTACSSGVKAISLARDLINNNISDAVIVAASEPISTMTLYGFNSLEILSFEKSNPMSKNKTGINIGEGAACLILEKNSRYGIDITGIGENTDSYHITASDPSGEIEKDAILFALNESDIKPKDVDYINLHGTGTHTNDITEANAISKIFGNNIPSSSTKIMTGHCLGASAIIEIALCCHLLNNFEGKLFPHVYDYEYDDIPKINLAEKNKKYDKCEICISNSYGFNGTNATVVLRKKYEK